MKVESMNEKSEYFCVSFCLEMLSKAVRIAVPIIIATITTILIVAVVIAVVTTNDDEIQELGNIHRYTVCTPKFFLKRTKVKLKRCQDSVFTKKFRFQRISSKRILDKK